tara:strand:- start:4453 stop:4671 length:219 start_codon:yes stop_codon:yes gene_type:complete
MFHYLPDDIKRKIEFQSCIFLVSQKYKYVHRELLSEYPLLFSYLNTTIDPDIDYFYADRLPALISCESDSDV